MQISPPLKDNGKKFSQTRTELYPSENILLRELLGVWKLRKRETERVEERKIEGEKQQHKQVKPKIKYICVLLILVLTIFI